jgi:hypothetical protein
VFQDGVANGVPALAAIPVGQRVDIAGQPIANGAVITDCTVPTSLDATLATATTAYPTQPLPGFVRMQTTTAQGTVASSTAGTATVNLLQLGPFDPTLAPFSLANAGSFNIGTGSLVLPTPPAAGTLPTGLQQVLTFTGNPAVQGTSPPDFTASAVSANPTELIIEWWAQPTAGGTPTPFTNVSGTGATGTGLQLNGADPKISRAVLQTGPTSIPLTSLPGGTTFPTIMTTDGTTTFTVGNTTDGVFQFMNLAAFEKEVSRIMAASTSTATLNFFKLVAQGQCTDATCATFNATRVTLVAQ